MRVVKWIAQLLDSYLPFGTTSSGDEVPSAATTEPDHIYALCLGDAVTVTEPAASSAPVDAVTERLNDPAVAASLVTLRDNAELLSTLVHGLSSLIERSDTIMESVAGGVQEFKASGAAIRPEGTPSLAELGSVAGELSAAAPALTNVLQSPMVQPETIELLGMVAEAATEGADRARTNRTEVAGAFAALRALKDPEVARGLGLVIEIARSLGRRMGTAG